MLFFESLILVLMLCQFEKSFILVIKKIVSVQENSHARTSLFARGERSRTVVPPCFILRSLGEAGLLIIAVTGLPVGLYSAVAFLPKAKG